MKNILAIVPSLMPTVNITIVEPFLYLQQNRSLSFKITLPYFFKPSMLESIDCVIFCRNSNPNDEWILKEVISRNIPYIYEIDDDFFEIAYDNILGRNHRHPTHLVTLQNFIRNASLVRVYSPLMAENIQLLNKKIEINTTYFNSSLISGIPTEKSSKIKIVYATSRMADQQQSIFNEALIKIALEFSDTVEIYFWGAPITDEELKKQKNVFHLEPIYDYTRFIQKFYSMRFDIGLAPIFGNRFFNSKTNNKYREYGGCQVAGVYSNEPLYTNCIQNERNGILVDNKPDSWYEGIRQLITDDQLRYRIINNAHQDIMQNYSFAHYCDQWQLSLQKAINEPNKDSSIFGLYEKNTRIDCILLHDHDLGKELSFIKDKLISEVYPHTKIAILTSMSVELDDLYKIKDHEENHTNILVFSDDADTINYFKTLTLHNSKKNIILVTTNPKQLEEKSTDNLKIICTSQYSSKVFAHFSENIYFLIDDAIKHTFKQHQIPNQLKIKIKHFIKHNFLIRKVMFLISKKNSIKLRIHGAWMLYKINHDKH